MPTGSGRRHEERWERNSAFWIRIIREELDPFRTGLTDAAVLDAVGPCRGRAVLDAGCGEGYLSRLLARRGAAVTGIDRAMALVKAATERQRQERARADFFRADLGAVPLASGTFDVVVSNHSINELRYPRTALSEFSRVLRPSGTLVVLMLHPCFYAPRTEKAAREDFPLERYFSVRRVEQRFNVSGVISPTTSVIWLRPLEEWFSMLTAAGFCVSDLREPHPSPRLLEADDWWRSTFHRPLFLLLVAMKVAPEREPS